jgi:phytoene synthase
MGSLALYDRVCRDCSVRTTQAYSTSFSLGIRFLGSELREAIYAIYGFVRFADEIVDTFHDHDKAQLFARFKADTYEALDVRISMNPILHAFQRTYHAYGLEREHVDLFLRSMEWDLDRLRYDRADYDAYIVGSAEVVGLMCLKVFVHGDEAQYQKLLPAARRLGAAFQKINFLRDLQADFQEMGRAYFPGIDLSQFDEKAKREIEAEIDADFQAALVGIQGLPRDSRLGVYVAYIYYTRLFKKIRALSHERILEARVRIPNAQKATLFVGSYLRHSFNLL